VSIFDKFHIGNGKLKPKLLAALESEGVVLVEEGLRGSVRYEHFKAPGRRFNGKVTGERIGLGLSEKRFVVYCRSGSTKLIDTEYSDPRLHAIEVTLEDDDTVVFRIDFDRVEEKNVSGVIRILAHTPNAASVVEQLRARLGRV
jgi:hypothetical protein